MSYQDALDILNSVTTDCRPHVKTQLLNILNEFRLNEEALSAQNEELRRQSAELAAMQRQLGDIMDNMVAMIGLMTPDGTLIKANRNALQAAGLSPADVLGKPFESTYWWAWSPDVQKRLRAAIERCASGQGSRYDELIRVGENEFRTIDFMLAPMFGPDGRVTHLIPSAIDITERKHAEEQIHSIARFPAENPNPVMRATVEGLLLYANAASQPLLDSWGTTVGKALPDELIDFGRNVFDQGQSLELAVACGPKNYLFSFTPVPEGPYINLYGRDNTTRMLTEEALRQSEDKFRNIFHTSASLISISTIREGRYLDVNDAFLETTGYTRQEVVGKHVEELGIWVDLEHRERLIKRVEAHGRITNEEVLLRTKGGHIITTLISAAFIKLNGERCIIFSSTDISARKLAQERFWTLADNMSQLAWIADRNGSRFWYNRRWYAFTGSTLEEVHGWGWTKVHHPDHVDRAVEKLGRCFRTGEVWEDTFPLRGKTGEYRWFLARAVPIRDQNENIMWWLGTDTDITEQRQAQEALRRMNETLEQQVVERTALATNRAKQLQALAVELVEAEERERRRIAQVLHDDLQQMLAGTRLMLQSASEKLPPVPEIAEVQQLLEESIKKSRSLSHELSPAVLHHSGLVAALEWLTGQMKAQFDLNTVLENKTDIRLENMPIRVFVFRAVQELLFNTVKHAGVKSALIEIADSGDDFFVTISDRGKGFDPEALNRLNAKVGFGLLTIRERANYIGAQLAVDSAPGRGSRFTLKIPLALVGIEGAQPQFAAAAVRPLEVQESPAISTATGVVRVLFADDHKVIRHGLIKLMTGQPGIHVVGEAANGREAIEQARRLNPDVIVMDISMPEMDGIEATRRIKAELPEVRVVGLSMHDNDHISNSMCRAGAESLVNKAGSPAQLLQAIYGVAQEKNCRL